MQNKQGSVEKCRERDEQMQKGKKNEKERNACSNERGSGQKTDQTQRIKGEDRNASSRSIGQKEGDREKDVNRGERLQIEREAISTRGGQRERQREKQSQQSARMELGGSPRESGAHPRGIPGICNHQFAYPIQFWSHSSVLFVALLSSSCTFFRARISCIQLFNLLSLFHSVSFSPSLSPFFFESATSSSLPSFFFHATVSFPPSLIYNFFLTHFLYILFIAKKLFQSSR